MRRNVILAALFVAGETAIAVLVNLVTKTPERLTIILLIVAIITTVCIAILRERALSNQPNRTPPLTSITQKATRRGEISDSSVHLTGAGGNVVETARGGAKIIGSRTSLTDTWAQITRKAFGKGKISDSKTVIHGSQQDQPKQ